MSRLGSRITLGAEQENHLLRAGKRDGTISIYIYICIYMCVCVCVCMYANAHFLSHAHKPTRKAKSETYAKVAQVLEFKLACQILHLRDTSRSPLHKRQRTATHCNTLQHTATHCNTLQHTATHHTLWHTNIRLTHFDSLSLSLSLSLLRTCSLSISVSVAFTLT